MAIQSTAIWEVRPSGDANNGAGWDSGISGAGTDYSQQDAAQLTLTDGVCNAASTTLTSTTGGFTSQMVGNALYVSSGTNALTEHFFITAFTDTNTVTVDRTISNGTNATGINFKVGGGKSRLTDQMCEDAAGGNTIYVKSGSITQSEAVSLSSSNATYANPIVVEGYDTSRGDNPTGSNRPAVNSAANELNFEYYWVIKNLEVTGTASNLFNVAVNDYAVIFNCKVENTSGSGGRSAVTGRSWWVKSCELISTNGNAFNGNVATQYLIDCYIHDSSTGVDGSSGITHLINCIVDTCPSGASTARGVVKNSVFYNCSTHGLKVDNGSGSQATFISECIFDSCGNGLELVASSDFVISDYNLYNNNTTDVTNITKGSNSVTADPNFTDAANGDFTCSSGGGGISAGQDMTEVGLTGDYKINIGVDQDDNAAGGGESSYTWVG